MPLLTLPLALIALVSLPALVAIYWLRNRLRRQEVSSLHLWLGQREAREGGRRVQKMQIPLLLLLELLALLLLVLAATDPRMLLGSQQRPLVVVLDDSYSMLAGGQTLARDDLKRLLAKESPLAVRLVLARQTPQALSSTLASWSQVDEALAGWTCLAPSADISSAVSLAYELAGPEGRVLVMSDHLPAEGAMPVGEQEESRLVWKAMGEARPNVAIVNAVRSSDDQGHRALLEIANLSRSKAVTRLSINGSPSPLSLEASEVRRLWLTLPDASATLRAELDDDALALDNRVTLLPGVRQPVRVGVNVKQLGLATMLDKAILAQGATRVTRDADLVISDQPGTLLSTPQTWRVKWQAEEDSAAFVGPFLVDEQHPLTQGLELQGVVWGAKQQEAMPGRTVIAAGNTPLVSVTDHPSPHGPYFDVEIRLNPDQSTIGSTPAFPVLVWNLLAWRQSLLPGLSQANVRLGGSVSFTPPRAPAAQGERPAVTQVQIIAPDGQSQTASVQGQSVNIEADQPGVYQLVAQGQRFELASNALSPQESDLTNLSRGSVGDWLSVSTLRRQYTSMAWLLLLAALGVLGLHAFLTWRSAGGAR